jgi:hypothetical protein
MRMQRILATGLLITCFGVTMATSTASAAPSYTPAIGARPNALGGAYVGLADDAYAVYWNAAGLPRLQRQEFLGGYIPTQYVSGLSNGYGAATIPIGENQAIGADVFYDSFSDSELEFTGLAVRAAYGYALGRSLSLGLTGKFYSPINVTLDGVERGSGRAIGFDASTILDVGPLVKSLDGLRLGLVVRDIGGTNLVHDENTEKDWLAQELVYGASYRLGDSFLLTTQLDDRLHLGAEYTLYNMVALRMGTQKDVLGYGNDMLYSAGVGIKWRGLQFAYSFEYHPVLPATHYMGLSFAYNPSFVTIREAHVSPSPIYRALYRSYEISPDFVEVTLKNTSPDPLTVAVGITVPTMMLENRPHVEEFILPPQATQTVQLGVTVDDSVLMRETSSYDNLVQPEVFVTYQQEREEKRAARQLDAVYVLGRNKMTWENPLRICTFITPEHRTVVDFSNRTVNEFRQMRDEVFDRCRNLGTAMLLFDAVGKYGINYNPDQTTPYYKLVSDTTNMRTIFDTINYPVDTFREKLGDCDDVTVLFSSLLESQNIPTALLDVFDPVWGHVYMMFDTGLTPDEAVRSGLFLDATEFVAWVDPNGEDARPHAWIPVETTMFGHTFMEAWLAGIEEYREKAARDFVRIWSVGEGRQKFVAGTVDSLSVQYPNVSEIQNLVNLDMQQFRQRLELPPLQEPLTAEKYYVRGTELVQRAQYTRAIESFDRAIEMTPGFPDAYNGRGVAYNHEGGRVRFLPDNPAARRQEAEGYWNSAVQDFQRAIQIDSQQAGYWVNLMISYRLLNDTEQARRARNEALDLDEGLRPILQDAVE